MTPRSLNTPLYLTIIFWVLLILGTAVFITGILGSRPLRAWQACYINFLYWSGMAFGAVVFTAVLNITDARWGRPLKRLAEAFAAFLPAGFMLFWLFWPGRLYLFPWVSEPIPDKGLWLNDFFFFARGSAGYLLLAFISLLLVICSLKGDLHALRKGADTTREGINTGLAESLWKKQLVLSPVLTIAYCFFLSLMGFDLVMSLDRQWVSNLFGGYFFTGSFYTGIAAVCLIALSARQKEALKEYIGPGHFHDLGKLLFAFCIFTGYLFYTQFLVIWYGNIPQETQYLILRLKLMPWQPLAWVVLILIFLFPFLALISRRIKLRRVPMILICISILAGMWLERFILVAPSLWKDGTVPLGITEAAITCGYLGLVGLCVTTFLKYCPAIPLSDPLFRKSLEDDKERLAP